MKINFLGDSITEGVLISAVEKRYSTLVAKHFGAEELNFGLSGSRIAKQVKRTLNPDDDVFMVRAVKMPTDADFTFVFGGTNDFGHGDAKLGVFDDRDTYTFYGAMHELALYTANNFPKEKLCFILPLPRVNQDDLLGDGTKDAPMATLGEYKKAQKEVLDYYGIESIDLSDEFYLPTSYQDDGNLFADGLHPNEKGHRHLADCLIKYLQNKGL